MSVIRIDHLANRKHVKVKEEWRPRPVAEISRWTSFIDKARSSGERLRGRLSARQQAVTYASCPARVYEMQGVALGVAFVVHATRDDVEKGSIIRQLTSGDMGLLTGPHQMLSLELSSSTTRLSEGERPVLAPE